MPLPDPEVIEQAIQDPSTRTVPEGWKAAAEHELHSNFYGMHAATEATKEGISRAGTILPMKGVWTIKAGEVTKCMEGGVK